MVSHTMGYICPQSVLGYTKLWLGEANPCVLFEFFWSIWRTLTIGPLTPSWGHSTLMDQGIQSGEDLFVQTANRHEWRSRATGVAPHEWCTCSMYIYTHHGNYTYKCSSRLLMNNYRQTLHAISCWESNFAGIQVHLPFFGWFLVWACVGLTQVEWLELAQYVWKQGPRELDSRNEHHWLWSCTAYRGLLKHKMDLRRDKMYLTFGPYTFQFEQHLLEAVVDSPKIEPNTKCLFQVKFVPIQIIELPVTLSTPPIASGMAIKPVRGNISLAGLPFPFLVKICKDHIIREALQKMNRCLFKSSCASSFTCLAANFSWLLLWVCHMFPLQTSTTSTSAKQDCLPYLAIILSI